jgi:hypothetical protein
VTLPSVLCIDGYDIVCITRFKPAPTEYASCVWVSSPEKGILVTPYGSALLLTRGSIINGVNRCWSYAGSALWPLILLLRYSE